MKKKIVFIMNPISGTSSKAAVPSLIDSTLDKEQFEYEIKMTERPGHASELAAEARDNRRHRGGCRWRWHCERGSPFPRPFRLSIRHSALRLRKRPGAPPAVANELEEEH